MDNASLLEEQLIRKIRETTPIQNDGNTEIKFSFFDRQVKMIENTEKDQPQFRLIVDNRNCGFWKGRTYLDKFKNNEAGEVLQTVRKSIILTEEENKQKKRINKARSFQRKNLEAFSQEEQEILTGVFALVDKLYQIPKNTFGSEVIRDLGREFVNSEKTYLWVKELRGGKQPFSKHIPEEYFQKLESKDEKPPGIPMDAVNFACDNVDVLQTLSNKVYDVLRRTRMIEKYGDDVLTSRLGYICDIILRYYTKLNLNQWEEHYNAWDKGGEQLDELVPEDQKSDFKPDFPQQEVSIQSQQSQQPKKQPQQQHCPEQKEASQTNPTSVREKKGAYSSKRRNPSDCTIGEVLGEKLNQLRID